MNTDMLRKTFRDLEENSATLDPARVIAGGRRRGIRRRAVALGATALGTAVVVAAGSALTGPVAQPPAPAAGPTPCPTDTATASYETPPPTVVTPPPPAVSLPVPPPPPVVAGDDWVPVVGRGRFRLTGENWQLLDVRPGAADIFGEVDCDMLSNGWEVILGFGSDRLKYSLSLLRGDIRRVVYTGASAAGFVRAEGRVRRLAALPGWVMADGSYRVDGKLHPWGGIYAQATLDAYDGSGRRVLHCHNGPDGGICTKV